MEGSEGEGGWGCKTIDFFSTASPGGSVSEGVKRIPAFVFRRTGGETKPCFILARVQLCLVHGGG